MNILGVKVDNLSKQEIIDKISCFLNEDNFHQIATVNPEFILKAQKDEEFKNILNGCDLNIADGVGIKFAFWWFRNKLKSRMAGADLMQEILKIADEKKLKIYLATNKDGLSSFEEAREAILKQYPNLEIDGVNFEVSEVSEVRPRYRGLTSEDVVFCNFGAPFQEKFLNSVKCDKIRLAVGVGGSFDYLTGKTRRAPKWMRIFGFEWFWRFLLQPKRIRRIFDAVVVFPVKIILN